MYSQVYGRWANKQLGKCPDKISKSGCFLTSFCNLLQELDILKIEPDVLNDTLIRNNLYSQGCLFNAPAIAKYFNLNYEVRYGNYDGLCIAETNHFSKIGIPQHFFLYKDGMRIDSLDLDPQWEKNDYKIKSYRIFTKKEQQEETQQLVFPDISHYQGAIDWATFNPDALIMKATEGLTNVDPTLKTNQKKSRLLDIPIGYYHFFRGANPIKQADWFMENVGELKTGEFLILDFEIKVDDPQAWCLSFLERVESKIGFKTFIYMNESTANSYDWSKVIERDYPLWVAKYKKDDNGIMGPEPKLKKWPGYVLWQYTSKGKFEGITGNVDLNIFEGTAEQLAKYGKWPKVDEQTQPGSNLSLTGLPDYSTFNEMSKEKILEWIKKIIDFFKKNNE